MEVLNSLTIAQRTLVNKTLRIIRLSNLEENNVSVLDMNAIWREYSVLSSSCIAMIVCYTLETVTEKIFDSQLGFTKNGEFLLVAYDGQLVFYNSNSQEIKSLQVRGPLNTSRAIVYEESLWVEM
jgi:hypothetical protein